MDKLKKLFAKKTEKIRYKCVELIIKKLTPFLYRKILIVSFMGIDTSIDFIRRVPRPSIKMMKEYFKDKSIFGAEIGVDSGINSKSILKELNIKKLYLIDIWKEYVDYKNEKVDENFKITFKKFKGNKKVEIIKDYSVNAVKNIKNNSLDFVYIDANHAYKYVYQDIKIWTPKVKKGGIVAGHDVISCIQVFEAVRDFCYKNKIFFYIELPDWWFIK